LEGCDRSVDALCQADTFCRAAAVDVVDHHVCEVASIAAVEKVADTFGAEAVGIVRVGGVGDGFKCGLPCCFGAFACAFDGAVKSEGGVFGFEGHGGVSWLVFLSDTFIANMRRTCKRKIAKMRGKSII
jgi:hypothetical protein